MDFKAYIREESILRALDVLGWHTPTPIQEQMFASFGRHRSIIMQAQTGSGKSGAYLLPVLDAVKWEENQVQCLILAPTRELASQIREECALLGKYKRIKSVALIGKQPMVFQIQDLHQKCHVAVGTPGRVLEHLRQGSLRTDRISHVVLDEADEMLQLGFRETLEQILNRLPEQAHYCLCSATMPDVTADFCAAYFPDCVKIGEAEALVPKTLFFDAYVIAQSQKDEFLWKLLLKEACSGAIIFCNTRATCEHVYLELKRHIDAVGLYHGAMEQAKREAVWVEFRYGTLQFLVASDIAARGLDSEAIEVIIHYELPLEKERFIHRSGRSGRNQQQGHVISLIDPLEVERCKEIERYSGIQMRFCDTELVLAQATDQTAVVHLTAQRKEKAEKKAAFCADVLRLYIHGGKKQKISAGDLVGAMTQFAGVTGDDIGVIQIQDYGSYVEILHGKGSYVYECLQRATIKKHRFKVEIAHHQ